jgi:hypothetical protein
MKTGNQLLKHVLVREYGIPDKRVRDIGKVKILFADGRGHADYGADKQLLSPFCSISVEVENEDRVKITLGRNIPTGAAVTDWIERHQASYNGAEWPVGRLSMFVSRGEQGKLESLASAIRSIVAPGTSYRVKNHKYTCPRTADSLNRLKKTLDEAWLPGSVPVFGTPISDGSSGASGLSESLLSESLLFGQGETET